MCALRNAVKRHGRCRMRSSENCRMFLATEGKPYSAATSAASSDSAYESSSYGLPMLYRQPKAMSCVRIPLAAFCTAGSGTSNVAPVARRSCQNLTTVARAVAYVAAFAWTYCASDGRSATRRRSSASARRERGSARRRRANSAPRADDQACLAGVGQAVGGGVREQLPRHEPHRRGVPRMARVDVELHEADDGASAVLAVRASDERLLVIPHAAGVGVRGLQDREVTLRELRRLEAGRAGAVRLGAVADVDRERRPADPARDDLAAVGDVQRIDGRAVWRERERERDVVRSRSASTSRPTALRG